RVKGLLVIALPIGALIVSVITTFAVNRHVQAASSAVNHSLLVRETLQSSLTLLVDAETGVRGYLLTADANFMEPERKSREALPQVLRELHQLMQDDPQQLARVGEL